MILSGYGISLDLPEGWEGRIFKLNPGPGESVFPNVHAANFPLPTDQSNYGTGASLQMNGHGAFFALVEYDPALLGRDDFAVTTPLLPVDQTQLLNAQALSVTAGLVGYRSSFSRAEPPI